MSTSLYWRPLPVSPPSNCIHSLKYILSKKLGLDDGPTTVDRSFIDFLEGVSATADTTDIGKEARKLIDAINKHSTVELYLH